MSFFALLSQDFIHNAGIMKSDRPHIILKTLKRESNNQLWLTEVAI